MNIRSKAALAVLTFALGCAPLLAQGDDPPDPPAMQQGGPNGMGPRRQMGPGRQMDGPDGWGGGMQRQWGRDGRMGMGMRGRGGERGEFGLSRLLANPDVRQQIGVTEEQAAKIRQQESDFRKEEIRSRADLEIKRMDLRDLLAVDKPDRSAIDSKLQEISAAQLAGEKSRIDFRLNMKDALTPAQRQKLRDWMNQRRDRRESGGGPRGPQQRGARGGQRGNPPPPPNAQGQGQAPASH